MLILDLAASRRQPTQLQPQISQPLRPPCRHTAFAADAAAADVAPTIPPPCDSICSQIPNLIYPYPGQLGMRRTMAGPCICHNATCPHLEHVHIWTTGASAASPEEPNSAKILFLVRHQSILHAEALHTNIIFAYVGPYKGRAHIAVSSSLGPLGLDRAL